MKTFVLIVSEKFPATHSRAGEETGFMDAIADWTKIHTIRANYELWEKRIAQIDSGSAELSIRAWEGKPYRSKQREVFKLDPGGVGIEKLTFPSNEFSVRFVNDKPCFATTEEIGKNDGLSFIDFYEWFKGYDLTKTMAIIHFSNFRYAGGVR